MTHPRAFSTLWTAIVACIVIATACGGRVVSRSGGTSNNDSTADQGSISMTGGAGTNVDTQGGESLAGGSLIEGSGSAGTSEQPGGNGASGASSCSCPQLFCGPGLRGGHVGACCQSCEPCNLECPPTSCPAGMHSIILPSQCCATCAPGPKSCVEGDSDYHVTAGQLLEDYRKVGCNVDSDCVMAPSFSTGCSFECDVPIPAAMVNAWKMNLMSLAEANCSNCPPHQMTSCPKFVARCAGEGPGGRCYAGLD
jgi:hypothetical protein